MICVRTELLRFLNTHTTCLLLNKKNPSTETGNQLTIGILLNLIIRALSKGFFCNQLEQQGCASSPMYKCWLFRLRDTLTSSTLSSKLHRTVEARFLFPQCSAKLSCSWSCSTSVSALPKLIFHPIGVSEPSTIPPKTTRMVVRNPWIPLYLFTKLFRYVFFFTIN